MVSGRSFTYPCLTMDAAGKTVQRTQHPTWSRSHRAGAGASFCTLPEGPFLNQTWGTVTVIARQTQCCLQPELHLRATLHPWPSSPCTAGTHIARTQKECPRPPGPVSSPRASPGDSGPGREGETRKGCPPSVTHPSLRKRKGSVRDSSSPAGAANNQKSHSLSEPQEQVCTQAEWSPRDCHARAAACAHAGGAQGERRVHPTAPAQNAARALCPKSPVGHGVWASNTREKARDL